MQYGTSQYEPLTPQKNGRHHVSKHRRGKNCVRQFLKDLKFLSIMQGEKCHGLKGLELFWNVIERYEAQRPVR